LGIVPAKGNVFINTSQGDKMLEVYLKDQNNPQPVRQVRELMGNNTL
jgi:hypothetical protein